MGYGGGILLLEVERPGPEADHSPVARMTGAIALFPLYAGEKRDKFAFKCSLRFGILK